MSSIGTFKESSLHKHLKYRYAENGRTEINRGSFVYDGQRDDGELIEVQTGSFAPLKNKIASLTKKEKIRIIHPIIINSYIELYDAEGNFIKKRKSPKKGCAWDIFNALIYAPQLPLNPRLKLELIFLDIIEKRKDDGKGSWRRKGVSIEDKVPISWHESIILKKLSDYHQFIPLEEELFTVKDLQAKTRISQSLARKCLYVLKKIGIIEQAGKKGNAYVYKKSGRLKPTAFD